MIFYSVEFCGNLTRFALYLRLLALSSAELIKRIILFFRIFQE
ncbi:Hypothetical protein ETEE_2393 [Edwardsiella anguillarum ET080813]|uniref:Uncharacterized protein n=1 Tax=Edwardsiella anguillarum ET080813 TaxID=667120 RepID=A0A076LTA3_9GAMM|nr:Hypothetical protein ETEE_2393 [Edwardsiella anguillarum ET080813]